MVAAMSRKFADEEYLFDGVIRFNSFVYPFSWDSEFVSPLCEGFGFSLVCNEGVVSAIVRLCFLRSPAAILGAVVSVDILPLDGEVVSVSVGQCPVTEGFKATSPLWADRDAAAAVVWVVYVFASPFHATPCCVQLCVPHAVLRLSSFVKFDISLRQKAPAAFDFFCSKMV